VLGAFESTVKFFVAPHPTDTNKEITYVSLEGPEAATFVRVRTNLVNGEAIISLPETYAMVTADDGLTAQVTPRGEWLQLYVADVNRANSSCGKPRARTGGLTTWCMVCARVMRTFSPSARADKTAAALARPQPLSNTKGQGQP